MIHNDYVGQCIDGKYSITRLLGRGGVGTVYLAHHIVSDEQVAVKFLHSQFAKREDLLAHFYDEARVASLTGHANIAEVYEQGISEAGEPYIAMEYLQGESFADFLSRSGPLSLDVACAVLEPVLQALEAAHARGIVHGHLKPQNIFLVHQEQGPPHIKLVDFGVSKLTNPDQVEITRYGVQLGAPSYLSPEQLKGANNVDHRTDIYSIGVLMYEMLTGKIPFQGSKYHDILIAATSRPPLPPGEANPSFPSEAEALLVWCMEKLPENRPADAHAVLACVQSFTGFDQRKESFLAAVATNNMRTMIGKGSTVIGEVSEVIGKGGTVIGDVGEDLAKAVALAKEATKNKAELKESKPTSGSSSISGRAQARKTSRAPARKTSRSPARKSSRAPVRKTSRSPLLLGWLGAERRKKTIVILALSGGLLLMLGIILLWVNRGEPNEELQDETALESEGISPREAAAEHFETPGRNQEAATRNIQIEVREMPKGAKIFYNNIPVPLNPFRVEVRDTIVPMRVEASGFKPFITSVVPSEDQVVVVNMVSLSEAAQQDLEDTQILEEEEPPAIQPSVPKPVVQPSVSSNSSSAEQRSRPKDGRSKKKKVDRKAKSEKVQSGEVKSKDSRLMDIKDVFE